MTRYPDRLILLGPSVCLLLLSLALPAIGYIDPSSELPGSTTGYVALTQGWLIAFVGLWDTITLDEVGRVGSIAWFANPALAIAWIFLLLRAPRPALIAGRTALVLGLLFFVCPDLPIDHSKEMRNMHGSFGFYVWILSMAAAWHAATKLLPSKIPDKVCSGQ